MPAYLYKVTNSSYQQVKEISLSGYGIIYNIFERKKLLYKLTTKTKGIPWDISKQELREQIQMDESKNAEYEIVFDVEPKKVRTNLKQLQYVYLFTHNYGEKEKVHWTVMMLKLKTILFDEFKKRDIDAFVPEPDSQEITEFLYLQNNWTYGMVGRMNAAMIEPEARDYFKLFF